MTCSNWKFQPTTILFDFEPKFLYSLAKQQGPQNLPISEQLDQAQE